ncbi:hypothetical protein T08_928 [Trichinella sp. T8]|nr:hypothetical protein T08_928 [Trichinella sp. T8]
MPSGCWKWGSRLVIGLQNAKAILLWSATITGVVFQDYEKFRRLCYLNDLKRLWENYKLSYHVLINGRLSFESILCHLHSTEMTIVKTP